MEYFYKRLVVVCIIDQHPLGNQRTEISGGLNISEKLEWNSRFVNLDLSFQVYQFF